MEELLKKILAEVKHLSIGLDTLSNRVDKLAAMTAKRFDQLEQSTNERFEKLEARIDGLEGKVEGLTKEFRSFRADNERYHGILEAKLDKLNVRVFDLEGTVEQNVSDISHIKKVLDTSSLL